jgi:hypothetical protein
MILMVVVLVVVVVVIGNWRCAELLELVRRWLALPPCSPHQRIEQCGHRCLLTREGITVVVALMRPACSREGRYASSVAQWGWGRGRRRRLLRPSSSSRPRQ